VIPIKKAAQTIIQNKSKPKKTVAFSTSPVQNVYNKELDKLVPRESMAADEDASPTNSTAVKNARESDLLKLRSMYPDIVLNNNLNEDNWYCDICLDSGNNEEEIEDGEDLCICELCLTVVHPSCYRKDLYSQDPEDESSWFCQRCILLISCYQNGSPIE